MSGANNNKIESLPSSTIRLIGSSQVITSVFSVVKELLENSIDASASAIDIRLETYGLNKIEIIDNGCGIQAEDVPYVGKRHYTSKITSTKDLESLCSYGFRGEALASLCSVSNVAVTTKTKADDVGYSYVLDKEGNILDKTPSAIAKGTTICATNLFANLPVRKQFYNNSTRRKEDLKRIEEVLIAYSIVKPKLRLTLKHNKDLIWQRTSMDSTKTALIQALGRPVFNNMLCVNRTLEQPEASVTVYFPKPGSDVKVMSRSSHDRTFTVVNDRPVHLKEFLKILKQYYSTCHSCEAGRYPLSYVSVTVPMQNLDVNVDPNKTKVFLQNMKEISNFLEEILLEAYGPLENVPSWHYSEKEKISSDQTDEFNMTDPEKSIKQRIEKICNNNKEETIVEKPPKNNSSDRNKTNSDESVEILLDKENAFQTKDTESSKETEDPGTSEVLLDDLCSQAFFNDLLEEESETQTSNKNNNENENPTSNDSVKSNKESHIFSNAEVVNPIIIIENDEHNVNKLVGSDSNLSEINSNSSNQSTVGLVNQSSTGPAVSWSRGESLLGEDGKTVQPVKLLQAPANQRPSKRPLSSPGMTSPGPSKISRVLDVDQWTLHDMVSSPTVGSKDSRDTTPLTPFSQFCKAKKASEPGIDLNDDKCTERLRKAWTNLSNEDKVTYRDQHWQDIQRQKKEESVKEKKDSSFQKIVGSSKSNQPSIRDQMADLASQSQIQQQQQKKRKKVIQNIKEIKLSMAQLRKSQNPLDLENDRIEFLKPRLIGPLKSKDVHVIGQLNTLKLVNVQRLSEITAYKKLTEGFMLPTSHCENPILLNHGNISDNLWPTFEELVKQSYVDEDVFHLTDERITGNGFDVKCFIDNDGDLAAKLVGICDDVPTYELCDFMEVLQKISENPLHNLGKTRPLKVQYYLQGEAVRAVLEGRYKMSQSDIEQEIQDQNTDLQCIHHKLVFHNLFDLNSL